MKRVYFTLFGLALLAAIAGLGIAFGTRSPDGVLLAAGIGLFLAADLFIIGGLRREFRFDSHRLWWYHLVGTGAVLVGLVQVLFSVGWPFDSGTIAGSSLAGTIAGVVIVLIGVDFILGGIHHDLSRVE